MNVCFKDFFDSRRVYERLDAVALRLDEIHQAVINRVELRSANIVSDIGQMFIEFEDRVRSHIRDGYFTEEVVRDQSRLDEQQRAQWQKDFEMDRLWRKELDDDRRLLAEIATRLRQLKEDCKEKEEKKRRVD